MSDAKGRMRPELSLEPNGNPKLNFLDETAKVTCSLPDENKDSLVIDETPEQFTDLLLRNQLTEMNQLTICALPP